MILTSDGKICRNIERVQADSAEHPEAKIAADGARMSRSDTALHGADSSLVYSAYQHNPHKQWSESRQGKGSFSEEKITIHEHGFSVQCARWNDGEIPKSLQGAAERGKITGFSADSAKRLREFMLTNWGGSDSYPFAVTLTTRQMHTPERWESALKRFRTTLARKYPQWAACWRVELQKRKTPHLHCVFWFPEVMHISLVQYYLTDLWLRSIGEEEDLDSWKYAVSVKDLTGASGWVIYCTLHDSKHKKEQLGWKGRQWGIWNKKAWKARPPVHESTFTPRQRVELCRRLRQWSRGRFKGKRVKPLRFFFSQNIASFCMDVNTLRQLLRGIDI